MWGKQRNRWSRTGTDQQRLTPSEVPARSQARPTEMAAVPQDGHDVVGSAGDHGDPRRDANGFFRAPGHVAHDLSRLQECRELLRVHVELGDGLLVPEELLEQRGRDDAGCVARQEEADILRARKEVAGLLIDLGLVAHDPQRLGEVEGRVDGSVAVLLDQVSLRLGPAIHPCHGVIEGLSLSVHGEEGGPVRADHHPADAAPVPQAAAPP